MPTQLDPGPSVRAFRHEVRGWLEANRPEELVGVEAEQLVLRRVPGPEDWARKLHEAGLTCVSRPKEYGGRRLGGVELAVLNEEFVTSLKTRGVIDGDEVVIGGQKVVSIRGADSMVMPDQESGSYQPDRWQRSLLGTRCVTIWGGTAQVQRNIVGERVRGLPKEPAPGGER